MPSCKDKHKHKKHRNLYYNLLIKKGEIQNSVSLPFPFDKNKSSYSGIQNIRMIQKDGTQDKYLINFLGYRTPVNELLNIKALYNETVSIKSISGKSFITATAIYEDSGTTFASLKSQITYNITSSSGEFTNTDCSYNILDINNTLTIFCDNTDPTLLKRTVKFN